MKIRTGFVTNSSSTSFCIVGQTFDNSEIEKWFDKAFDVIAALHKKKTGEDLDKEAMMDEGDLGYQLGELLDLNVEHDYDGECYYIGINIELMKDNQTLGEVKQSVADKMAQYGLKPKKIEIISATISS